MQSENPPPFSATAPATKTSALAVISLVLGILGLVTCGLTALPGLILGIIALVKISNNKSTLRGHGIALAGTIVSGIFLLLIPIMAAMLLPALAAAKQKAQEITCVSQEKQLGLALAIYRSENGNHFPPAATWCDAIKSAAGSENTFKCKGAESASRCDYAFNAKLDGLDSTQINPQTVMIFEADANWNASGGAEMMIGKSRHAKMFNVAFADGSVHTLRENELSTLRWDP